MADFVVIAASPLCSPEFAVAAVATPERNAFQTAMHDGEEYTIMVHRKAYMNDILRGFRGGAARQTTTAHASARGMSADVWARVYQQFSRDVPRQVFCVDDEVHHDAETGLRHVRRLAAEELRIRQLLDEESRRKAVSSKRTSVMDTLWNSCKVMWPSRHGAAQSEPPTSFTREQLDQVEIDEFVLDYVTQHVALLSQQAALAFPLELIQAHMTSLNPQAWHCRYASSDRFQVTPNEALDVSQQHHVAEWSCRADPLQHRTRVVVKSTKQGALMVTLSKRFRVFKFDADGVDHNLRSVKLQLTADVISHAEDDVLNVLTWPQDNTDDGIGNDGGAVERTGAIVDPADAGDDSVILQWWIRDHTSADAPQTSVVNGYGRAATLDQVEVTQDVRCCECLGASAGIHRRSCTLQT